MQSSPRSMYKICARHDDVIKWKHFPRYWPFVRGIHRSPVKYPHKGQWRGALMFSLICVWINGWVSNGETGDFRQLLRPLWRHCNPCFVLIWQWSISPYIWEFHDCDWANVIVATEKVPRRILCLVNSLNDINTHYCDAIMGTVASQITSLTIVYTAVYSDADRSKHQSSA